MRSRQADVDAYLRQVSDDRHDALNHLRDLCLEVLVGYEEGMDYGMPCYRRPDGDVEVAFASQVQHISLYVMRKDVLDQFRDELAPASLGKGCVRYSEPEGIDFDLVRQMLERSAAADGRIC